MFLLFVLIVGRGSNRGFGVGIVVGPRAPLHGQLCLVRFICLFLVSPMLFLVHQSFSSQLRSTVYPSLCVILIFFVVVPRLPLMFLFRFISLILVFPVSFLVYRSISCPIPRHPLATSFHCIPLTVSHSHIVLRAHLLFLVRFITLCLLSPVPFLVYCSISCAISRFPLAACHSTIFLVVVLRIPPLFYVRSIYCFSYLTASPCWLPLAVCLCHIPFIPFHMREMLHACLFSVMLKHI